MTILHPIFENGGPWAQNSPFCSQTSNFRYVGSKWVIIKRSKRTFKKFEFWQFYTQFLKMGVLGPKSHNFGTDLLFLVCGFKVNIYKLIKKKISKILNSGDFRPNFWKRGPWAQKPQFWSQTIFLFLYVAGPMWLVINRWKWTSRQFGILETLDPILENGDPWAQ